MKKLSLLFLLIVGSLNVIKAQAPADSAALAPAVVNKSSYVGIGIGLPYGWLGFNVEAPLYKRLFFIGGAGIIPIGAGSQRVIHPTYNLGLEVVLAQPEKLWQPKLLALYGINGFAWGVDQYGNSSSGSRRAYKGITLGLSNAFMFGEKRSHGFSADLLYIASSEFFSEHSSGRFKLGLAYKYRFFHQ